MSRRKVYDFLSDLTDNNSKEWMDENRDRYHDAKDIWLSTIQDILDRLSKHNSYFETVNPKKTIMRINNNRMFHPDRPVYKDNFAFSPGKKEDPAFYLHVSPSDSFVGGGLYHPENAMLKRIRAAIDYDARELLDIVEAKGFQQVFGGLDDDPDALKTSPQGYTQEHPHIELLRKKNFTALLPLTQKEVIDDSFIDRVEEAYTTIRPLNDWLKKALSVEA